MFSAEGIKSLKLDMAAATEYNEEQLNYFRICCVTTDVLGEGLRTIFKQEWDTCYKASYGEWKDEPRNGLDFYHREWSKANKREKDLLKAMVNGDRAKWDCSMLFYAILHSDCIGSGLNAEARTNVDDLRKFRNEEFAHMPRGHLSGQEFQNAIVKVDNAFHALGLSRVKIQEIRNQTSLPTEELKKVLIEVDDLKQRLQEKEDKLQEEGEQRQVPKDQLVNDVSPFCILPPKPSHDVACRYNEVARITQQLKELKGANKSRLSYLYISGNPGSGKSQLAGLIAKRFFEEVKEIPCATAFVMTLNAESLDTLLESYASFARHLKCPECALTNIRNSKRLKPAEKIANLKTLISIKVELYTSWLLIVENVTRPSRVHAYLPESGNEQWLRGQIEITTQDAASIPSTNSFINHISVSKGMEPGEACSLLAMLSGLVDRDAEKAVAQNLDHQPLALASAATFVKEVRQNKSTSNFSWNDYLEKLEKGQRATETILSETNSSYPKSMTAAITLAVEKIISSDRVLNHTFSLISLCAEQPLSLEIATHYVLNADKEMKEENMIHMKIQRSSLLLFDEDESEVHIRVHQVVHDVIKTVTKNYLESQRLEVLDGAIKSLNQFIDDKLPKSMDDLDSLAISKHINGHLKSIIIETENMFSQHDISQFIKNQRFNIRYYLDYFLKFGRVCNTYCEFNTAQKYGNLAEELIRQSSVFDDTDGAKVNSLMGIVLENLSEFYQAKEYHERALTIWLQKLGPHDVDVARCYNSLALLLRKLGDLKQAKEYHERALNIRKEKLGSQHDDVATSYHALSLVLRDQGDLKQAKEYHERALAIRLQNLGSQHAESYNDLALVLCDQGHLKQSKEYNERALAIRLQRLADHHIDVATCYRWACVLSNFRAQGDLENAKEYHEHALTIRLQNLGPHHVDVAETYSHVALVLDDLGDLKQAMEYHERALAIQLQKLGPHHADVAKTHHNVALVLHKQGDLKQAMEYHERALTIFIQRLGPHHRSVASSYSNLACVLSDLGDLKQAKEYYERALAILLQNRGPHHIDVARTYSNLALVLGKQGDLRQAKEVHLRSLAIRLQKLGPHHLDVATSYDNLACALSDLGDLKQAKEHQERALAIRLEKLGPHHLDVATSYNNLACVLSDLGDLKQAKEYHERALAILLQNRGPHHIDVARTYNNLALVLGKQGDLKQAKEVHLRSLAIRLQKLGPHHVDVATSYNNLACVLSDLDDLKQAKECYERALAIRLEELGPEHPDVSTVQRNLASLEPCVIL